MPGFNRITLDLEAIGGKPCIRGHQLTVGTILGLVAAGHAEGKTTRGNLMIRSCLLGVTLVAGLAALGSCANDTSMRHQSRTLEPTMARAESLSIADLKGEWTGTLDQFSHEIEGTFPVNMTITGTTGNEFTGTMDWPTFNGCKTEIRGMFDGNVIRWTEIAYLVGDDVVLGGLYVGRFTTKSKIAGEWMDPKHTIFPKGPKYGVTGATIVLTKK